MGTLLQKLGLEEEKRPYPEGLYRAGEDVGAAGESFLHRLFGTVHGARQVLGADKGGVVEREEKRIRALEAKHPAALAGGLLGSVADVAGAIPLVRGASLGTRALAGVGIGGGVGALQPVVEDESRIPSALLGAALGGGAASLLGRGGAVHGGAARGIEGQGKALVSSVDAKIPSARGMVPSRLRALVEEMDRSMLGDAGRGDVVSSDARFGELDPIDWVWVEKQRKLPEAGSARLLGGPDVPVPVESIGMEVGPRARARGDLTLAHPEIRGAQAARDPFVWPSQEVPALSAAQPLPVGDQAAFGRERRQPQGGGQRPLVLESLESDLIDLPEDQLGKPHWEYFSAKTGEFEALGATGREPLDEAAERKLWKAAFPRMSFKKFTILRASMAGLAGQELLSPVSEVELAADQPPAEVPTPPPPEYAYGELEGRDPSIQAGIDYMEDIGKEGAVEAYGDRMHVIRERQQEQEFTRFLATHPEITEADIEPMTMGLSGAAVSRAVGKLFGRAGPGVGAPATGKAKQAAVPRMAAPSFWGTLAKDTADQFVMKSVSMVDDVAKVSPTARLLRNEIEHETGGEFVRAPDYHERVMERRGHFIGRLRDEIDKERTPFLGMLTREKGAKITEAVRGGAHGPLKGLMDDLHIYARDAGLRLGFIDKYFPRIYNQDLLATDEGANGLIDVFVRHGIKLDRAQDILGTITRGDGLVVPGDDFVNSAAAKVSGRPPRGAISAEHTRSLAFIPDDELAPFLINNPYDVLQRYVNGIVKRSEYARIFGADSEFLAPMLAKIREEAMDAGYPLRGKEENRFIDLSDYLRGTGGRIESQPLRKVGRFIHTFQLLRTMGLTTLSSLAEPLIMLERGHVDAGVRAIPDTMAHVARGIIRTAYKRFPKADITRAAEDVLGGMDESFVHVLEGELRSPMQQAIVSGFFKLNMLEQWTRMTKVAAFGAGKRMIMDNISSISGGGVSGSKLARQILELRELGLDEADAVRWFRAGASDADPYAQRIGLATGRFVNDVVMAPRVANKPLWMSNERFALLSQLKGYNTVFGNTVLKRWLTKIHKGSAGDRAKLASIGGLMIGTTMFANELREYIKYGPEGNPRLKDVSAKERVGMAIDRLGLTGAFQPIVDATYAYRFGSSGLSQALGPTVSWLEQVRGGMGDLAQNADADRLRKEFVNAIPIANIHHPVRNWLYQVLGQEVPRGRARRKRRER